MLDHYKRCNICLIRIPDREKQKKIFKLIITENLPKLMSDTKSQMAGMSENTKQDYCQTNKHPQN